MKPSRYGHVTDPDARHGIARLLRWARWARQCARRTEGPLTRRGWIDDADRDLAAARALARLTRRS